MKIDQLPPQQLTFVKNIDGWLSDPAANLLYSFAKQCKGKGVIVEIGSWKGKSTSCLGFGSKAGKKVKIYAIDPHTGSPFERQLFKKKIWTYEDFKRNMRKAKLTDIVTAKVMTSEKAEKNWKLPVELLWIDGSHVYEDVKKDFAIWFPHLINGGYVVMDDTLNIYGPRKVAIDNIYLSNKCADIGFVEGHTYGRKVAHQTLEDKMRNYYIFFLNYCSYIAWKTLPPSIRSLGKKLVSQMQ